MDAEYVVIMITASKPEEGEKIARDLLEKKLVACVNMIPSIRSFYVWKEKFYDEQEVMLIAKTRSSLVEKIIEEVKRIHSYETPEVISIPILAGSKSYLDWVFQNTTPERQS